MTLSTRDLSALPDPADLARVTKGLAALDAMLWQEWEGRFFSFVARWNPLDPAEAMASMRNGSGDEMYAWFGPRGVVVKGFAHDAFMTPFRDNFVPDVQHGHSLYPGLLAGFPESLSAFLDEPAFMIAETTFLLWREAGDGAWRRGQPRFPEGIDDPDGSAWMLPMLIGDAAAYADFARGNYDASPSVEAVARVLRLEPLTPGLLSDLGASRSLEALAEDLAEIAYPAQDPPSNGDARRALAARVRRPRPRPYLPKAAGTHRILPSPGSWLTPHRSTARRGLP